MKKFILFALSLALSLSLTACMGADKASENAADTPASDNMTADEAGNGAASSTASMSSYAGDGFGFDIPESWQKNFKAVTRDVGSAGNTYKQTDFYYTEGNRDIRLMSIGKYNREQWDSLLKNEKGAESNLLGESTDKNNVYSILYENHDYLNDGEIKKTIEKIKEEAMALKDKIMIK